MSDEAKKTVVSYNVEKVGPESGQPFLYQAQIVRDFGTSSIGVAVQGSTAQREPAVTISAQAPIGSGQLGVQVTNVPHKPATPAATYTVPMGHNGGIGVSISRQGIGFGGGFRF